MKHFKFILFCLSLIVTLNAQMLKDIVYVEDKDSSKTLIKDEFLNENTKKYTLVLGKLEKRHDPIEFFRRFKLTNALAYKYGENKEFMRVISGVYDNHIEAKKALKKLPEELLKFEPYYSRISWHQKAYNKNNMDKKDKIVVNSDKNSVINFDTPEANNLKNKLTNKNPKGYSLVLASFTYKNKERIIAFFKNNGIEDKALAHLYGKNKDKVKIVFGVYNSYSEAKEDIKKLNDNLKLNSPYVQKLSTIRSFYKKYNNDAKTNVVKLNVDKKVNNEENSVKKPKDNKYIKVVKKIEPPVTKRVLVKKEKKEPIQKTKKNTPTKVKKQIVKKQVEIKQKGLISNVLKKSKIADVFYVESDGDFNILNEVFLNDESSFYTLDLGEINIEQIPLDKFFIQYNLKNNALVYKYGENKELARVIYGAYETKRNAKEILEKLTSLGFDTNTKVSNIQEHQKLYKKYHEEILNGKNIEKKQDNKIVVKSGNIIDTEDSDFIYVNSSNKLKDAFFNKDSSIYTITLITFNKDDIDLKDFLEKNSLNSDVVVYSIGSQNNYYRVFYGAYNSSKECLKVIDNLDEDLKKNQPYVSKVSTNIRRFESYNNRKIIDAINNAQMVNISK
ncbi:MAG: hypothetical protein ACNI25_01345 [Halarcobacter sp.]